MSDVRSRLLRFLTPWTRLNARHPWSHNDAYGWWIAGQARRLRTVRPRRALDVGCGTGNLLSRLDGLVDQVVGLEPDAVTAAAAARRFAACQGVRVVRGTFDDRPEGCWDLVTLVAVLHHLPLEETLTCLRTMVKPGGRLVVVGLSRETPHDGLWVMISVLANPLIGLVLHPRPDGRPPADMTAPTRDPHQTLPEIRQVVGRVLPGARVRHGLFFRYTLVWQP